MPRVGEMLPSKFLKKEDCEPAILVTIAGVEQQNVGTDEAPEDKWVLLLEETKPMVLNSTNLQLLSKIFNSDDSDDWIGRKVVCYSDPNVSFGGKLIGGIRVRASKAKPSAEPQAPQSKSKAKPAPAAEEDDSDIPY